MKLTIDANGRDELLLIEGADNNDIIPGTKFFRNFSGMEKKDKKGKVVNSEGRRNFCLALNLPVEALDQLANLGIQIVELQSNNEEYDDQPLRFVRIQISENGRGAAHLYLMNEAKKRKKEVFGKEINLLDSSRFSRVELVIRTWHKDDGTTSLYLNNGYFWLQQDAISDKFADYEDMIVGEDEDGVEPF